MFADAHRSGMQALTNGDFKKLGEAIAVERNVIDEQRHVIEEQRRATRKHRKIIDATLIATKSTRRKRR